MGCESEIAHIHVSCIFWNAANCWDATCRFQRLLDLLRLVFGATGRVSLGIPISLERLSRHRNEAMRVGPFGTRARMYIN
jgi:hypothetical protein